MNFQYSYLEKNLFLNGAVNLYRSDAIFEDDCRELKKQGYRVAKVICDTFETFTRDVSLALNWQEQFGYGPWGGNLDALNDGFCDTSLGNNGKFAIAFMRFHRIWKLDKEFAHSVLDILEYQSRNHLLEGARMIGLVQTRDPHFETKLLGGRGARWNAKEAFARKRGA